MTSIKKPVFQVNPQKIEQDIEKFSNDIKDAQAPKGSLSMNKLGDESLGRVGRNAFEAVNDEFTKDVHHRGDACSSAYTRREEPSRLSKKKVQSVFDALIQAKSKVAKLDKNHDGKIDMDEANKATRHGFSGRILSAVMDGEIDAYKSELRSWIYSLDQVSMTLERRTEDEQDISEMSKFHAKSKLGAEALKWAFRDLKTSTGDGLRNLDVDGVLMMAESTPIPLKNLVYGDNTDRTTEGHLDDGEIMGMLQTDDLQAYIDATKAKVEDQTGGYFSSYMKGEDLPNVDKLDDPDYRSWVNDNSC